MGYGTRPSTTICRLIFVFQGPLYPVDFIKEPRYTNPEARLQTEEQLEINACTENRMSLCTIKSIRYREKGKVVKDFDDFAYLTTHYVVYITTTFNLKAGEKMFAEYRKSYSGGL